MTESTLTSSRGTIGVYDEKPVIEASSARGEPAWLVERRAEGARAFAATPMPTTALRPWKYTDISDLDLEAFPAAELASDIRRMVDFSYHNLRDAFKRSYFDVVFLRNVMMYFDYDMKKKVLENVFTAMRPGALLITGDVDPLRDGSDLRERSGLEPVRPNTYRKPTTAAPSAATRNHDVERTTHSGTIR